MSTKKMQVAEDIAARIRAGEWAVGDAIPSIEDLEAHYGVSQGTVNEARTHLVKQGILRPTHGKGTFVQRVPGSEPNDPIEALADARDAIDRATAALEQEVALRLTAAGPGSRAEIKAYIQEVITERTTPNDDTTAERLAHGITISVLHRLGASYSVAVTGVQDD